MENKKIIAEFIGYANNRPLTDGSLTLYNDWNNLMGVVEKINQIDNQRFTVLINSMDCKVYDNIKNVIVYDSVGRYNPDELKQSIYYTCIGFIKWYNQQK